MKRIVLLVALLMAFGAVAGELPAGAKAPGFKLVNAVDGKPVAFNPGNGKLSVVVFTCNQCPVAKAFEQRIIEVAKTYQKRGVVFYALDPNDEKRFPEESLQGMKERAKAKGYPFPYLKDGDSAIARAYGARVTPHVYLVDGKGVIQYRGYVDDSAKAEERKATGLTDALDSLLAQRAIAVSETRAFGCSIKWTKS